MNRVEPVAKSVGLIPPGRLGGVQKVGMLRHDDRSLSTLLNVAQIAVWRIRRQRRPPAVAVAVAVAVVQNPFS